MCQFILNDLPSLLISHQSKYQSVAIRVSSLKAIHPIHYCDRLKVEWMTSRSPVEEQMRVKRIARDWTNHSRFRTCIRKSMAIIAKTVSQQRSPWMAQWRRARRLVKMDRIHWSTRISYRLNLTQWLPWLFLATPMISTWIVIRRKWILFFSLKQQRINSTIPPVPTIVSDRPRLAVSETSRPSFSSFSLLLRLRWTTWMCQLRSRSITAEHTLE